MYYHFINRAKLGFIFFVCFSVCLISCSRTEVSSLPKPNPALTSTDRVLAKDFSAGQLEAHYLKHRDQFGNISQEQYLNNARELLNSALSKDILEKVRTNGDILRYRASSGEFAVMTKDGRIRTYFKANYKYWLKQ